jgi:hypothetical protein
MTLQLYPWKMLSHRSAASLPSLPQELVDKITSLLSRRADVSSLSMTSKNVRAATVEYLFQDITMVWYEDSGVERMGDDPVQNSIPRIDCLLRTLLENPQFADYVSTIDLQIAGYRASRYHKLPHKPPLPTMAASTSYTLLVDNALCRVGLHRTVIHEKMRYGVLNNEFDAVVALVLLMCPKMTSLTLGLDILLYNKFLSTVLGYALPGDEPSALGQLKTLKLGRNTLATEETTVFRVRWPRKWPGNTLDLHAYLPLFYLPTLQDVEISLPWLPYGMSFAWPLLPPPNLASLHTLHLPECSIQPEVLHNILLSTPNLTRLKYNCWMFYTTRFDASAFAAALELVKNTLMHLEVRLEFWSNETIGPGEDEEHKYVENECTLKNMVALETLSIPTCVLAGWWNDTARAFTDVLPPNVISVQLVDDCFWYESFDWQQDQLMAALRAFLGHEQRGMNTPRLKEIRVAYTNWEEDQELLHLCRQNRLAFASSSSKDV